MKNLEIEILKKNEGIEITKDQFEKLIDGIEKQRYIDLVSNAYFAKNTLLKRYYITRIAGKGKFVRHSDIPYKVKTTVGMFKLELEYKFIHPNNFSENEYVTQQYIIIV